MKVVLAWMTLSLLFSPSLAAAEEGSRTARAEIIAAPLNVTLNDLVEMFREHGFSRIPVFRGTLDSPLGLIHLKDLALKHGFGTGGKFTLRPMLRPMLYVPPSMPIGVLLQQMQQKRTHMALVIDEYGGVDGLVVVLGLVMRGDRFQLGLRGVRRERETRGHLGV